MSMRGGQGGQVCKGCNGLKKSGILVVFACYGVTVGSKASSLSIL